MNAGEQAALGVPVGLLEREPHLARLEAWWEETAELGRVAFVAGEAGAGKTSLVRAFAARLPPGTVVLEENCEALSTPAPLARCWCSRAGRRTMLLAGSGRGADALAIAGALLDLLGDSPGTVLVFEDLDSADDATIDVVRLLARRIESRAAVVVAMLRDDELTSQHPFRLGDLATAPAVRRLELGPLSLEAVGKLAAGTALDPAGVWRKTGGSPCFVTEVVAAGGEGVPGTARESVCGPSRDQCQQAGQFARVPLLLFAPRGANVARRFPPCCFSTRGLVCLARRPGERRVL